MSFGESVLWERDHCIIYITCINPYLIFPSISTKLGRQCTYPSCFKLVHMPGDFHAWSKHVTHFFKCRPISDTAMQCSEVITSQCCVQRIPGSGRASSYSIIILSSMIPLKFLVATTRIQNINSIREFFNAFSRAPKSRSTFETLERLVQFWNAQMHQISMNAVPLCARKLFSIVN